MPGSPKGKKAKVVLSPEEKKALKAQKKAAKKLAKEMLKRKLRMDRLDREAALGKLNWDLMKEKWRQMFLSMKVPEMRDDILAMEGCVERWMDARNYQIELMQEERDELHIQSNSVAQVHANILDRLFEIFVQRVNDMRHVYDKDAFDKNAEAQREYERIHAREEDVQDNMKAMKYQMEMNRDHDEDLMTCEMFLRVDDEKSKNAEKREVLKNQLEGKMERRWSQITGVLMDYQQSTESRRNHFLIIRNKDRLDSKEIFYQMRKTQRLSKLILDLKDKLENRYAPEWMKRLILDYRVERDKFYNAFRYLRKGFADEIKLDETQLKDLIQITGNVFDNLNQYSKLGENVLTLFAICRKFETEKEKVCDVGRSLFKPIVPKAVQSEFNIMAGHEREERKEELEFRNPNAAFLKDYEVLDKFWKKVGRVNLSRLGLIKSLCEMRKENYYLRHFVQLYMTQIANATRPCIPEGQTNASLPCIPEAEFKNPCLQ